MRLDKTLEVICLELKEQANNHRKSANKRMEKYKGSHNCDRIFEYQRLAAKADAIESVSKALTPKKVEQWLQKHKDKIS